MGGVFSRAENFTSLDLLWGGLAFHTVSMYLGVFFLGLARKPRPAAKIA
jgi:hypothetical protein